MAKQSKVMVNDGGEARRASDVGRSLVAIGEFDVSGNFPDIISPNGAVTKGGKFESKGYSLEVTYKDVAEALRFAFSTTRIIVQGEIRKALASRRQPSMRPGLTIKVNAQGLRAMSLEEKRQEALGLVLDDPETIKSATPEQLATLVRFVEQMQAKVAEQMMQDERVAAQEILRANTTFVEPEPQSDDDEFAGYDEDELKKLNLKRIQALAEQHEIDDWEEKTKAELIEALVEL